MSDGAKPGARSRAEWVTFGVASAILAAVIVSIVWLGANGPQPPSFTTRPEAPRQANGQYFVRIAVTNEGDETAEAVRVVAEIEVGGEVVEEGEQEIDFLSGGEEEEVEFVFAEDPAEGDLSVRVTGYKVP